MLDVPDRRSSVEFHEGDFLVKTLETKVDLTKAYQLRHRVFAERLGWVPQTAQRQETDMYDAWGVTLGLFGGEGTLLGAARLLPGSGVFMLENEFRSLLPAHHVIRKESDTAEITRLAVSPEIKDRNFATRVMLGVLKGAYQWAVRNNIRYYYLETEPRFLVSLRMLGFPCEAIGPAVKLPPAGVETVAALYDMVRFDRENGERRPDFLAWISTVAMPNGEMVSKRASLHRESEASFGSSW